MFPGVSVAVAPETLSELMNYLRSTGAQTDPAAAVDAAIRYWLAAMRDAAPDRQPAVPRGYQWKSLFLPEGTWLRMACGNACEYAIVEGDRIVYRGRSVSPNQFAVAHAGSVRNAWRDISLRLPGEKGWKRASQCRRDLRRAEQQATMVSPVPASQQSAAAAVTQPPARVPPAVPQWTEPERRKFWCRLEDVAFD